MAPASYAELQRSADHLELLPVLPLPDLVLFPGMIAPVEVSDPRSVRLLDAVAIGMHTDLVTLSQRDRAASDPSSGELHAVGTRAQVIRLYRLAQDRWAVVLSGVARMRAQTFLSKDPYLVAVFESVTEDEGDPVELHGLSLLLRSKAKEVMSMAPEIPSDAIQVLDAIEDPGLLADVVLANLDLPGGERQRWLETEDAARRLRAAVSLLHERLEILRLREYLDRQVKDQVDRQQRDTLLRQKAETIRRELGDLQAEGEVEIAADQLDRRISAAALPGNVDQVARKELDRLRALPAGSPEMALSENYLDWLIELPWTQQAEAPLPLDDARRLLDEQHHGLQPVKRRVLEFLAIERLRPGRRGPSLCLVGPPGVGKTSLGRSIASALGRRYVRLSLGGIADEAEIRGHCRTYVGALPGRILQAMRRVGVKNPVFVLDEVDKVGEGAPVNTLLDVLDPEQNHAFCDSFVELPFDLSRVIFILTANEAQAIHPTLRDRLEVLELDGYTLDEKVAITEHHLWPRLLDEHGLLPGHRQLPKGTLVDVITQYTREPGVRQLERVLATTCRDAVMHLATGTTYEPLVSQEALPVLLGPRRHEPLSDELPGENEHGTTLGLVCTPAGGEVVTVEATCLPGRGRVTLTGRAGQVLRESVQAAWSYLRSHAHLLGLPEAPLQGIDVHVHLPAAGVPKEGSSLGMGLLAAIISAVYRLPPRPMTAVCGELTLRGALLPVKRVRERVLAAHRLGLSQVLLPARNQSDLSDPQVPTPAEVDVVFCDQVPHMVSALFPGLRPTQGRHRAAASRPPRTQAKTPAPVAPQKHDEEHDDAGA
jgi:ATP-dependent Lon protease